MKIAMGGKIPPVSDNDSENFRSLIEKGKSMVSADFGVCSTGNILENETEIKDLPIEDYREDDHEANYSKAITKYEQVYRPPSCTVTKSAAGINAQPELPIHLTATNQYDSSYQRYPYYFHPFHINHFLPANIYPHQTLPTPQPSFPNFFHQTAGLPSQELNSTDFMVPEHNTAHEKKTDTNENISVENSQTLIELANAALQTQSHEPRT